MKKISVSILLTAVLLSLSYAALASRDVEHAANSEGYVAKKDTVNAVFDAISARLNKSVILSKQAARKQVTGNFDLSSPQALLEKLSRQLGLIWYHDGQSIYVYEASEMRNAVLSMRNVPLSALNDFLRKSGLLDRRYPLRGSQGDKIFYIAGPPIYVDLVTNSAQFLDRQTASLEQGSQSVGVIKLNNTFVNDRNYELRDQKVLIPGIATVIEKLLSNMNKYAQPNAVQTKLPPLDFAPMPEFPAAEAGKTPPTHKPGLELATALKMDVSAVSAVQDPIIIAYPDTNSLLVRGTPEQIRYIENLVATLDVAKRHVELSLWIVDLKKDDIDQLGVEWNGSVNVGNKIGVNLNSQASLTTLDGMRFIASVKALEQKNRAEVISRPVILTQENVPAIFDNNRTLYTKLLAERFAELQQVTFGTLVSVLPRFSGDGEIEMSLNIEDGDAASNAGSKSDNLPEISRTRISTVARVPEGKSLLIGGYTRDDARNGESKIPLLGDLPGIGSLFRYRVNQKSNLVRVFLIQPRIISNPLQPDAADFANQVLQKADIEIPENIKDVRNYIERQTGDSDGNR